MTRDEENAIAPVALVTGAAKRIGAQIVAELHKAGFRILIHCHQSLETAREQVASYNAIRAESAHYLLGDLSERGIGAKLIDQALAWGGRLDLLVNNASQFSSHEDDWDKLFATNLRAPYELSRAAFPYLEKTQGSIVNITDIHASRPLRTYAIYCQTKAALAMQTLALALEFAPKVRVNAVAPGSIIWPEGDNELSAEDQTKILCKTLLQRHGHPEYIAQAVMYCVNNDFVTGQTLRVDGGRDLDC